MAGRGLPLQTDTAISRIPQVSGSGYALQAQASMFGRIADVASSIGADVKKQAVEHASEQARKDFLAKDAETPDDEGVFIAPKRGLGGWQSAVDRSYNNMVEALSLDRAKRDARKVATEQRAKKENFGNVDAFSSAMRGWANGYMSGVPSETADEVELLLSGEIDDGANAVLNDRVQADITEARAEMDAGIEALMSDTEVMLREGIGAMDSEAVMAKTKELQDRLDVKAGNPLYGYSDGERELDSAAMSDRLMVASLVPEVRAVFDEKGYAGALDAADQLAGGLGRDEAATSNIRQRLRQEANLMNQNLNAKQEAQREADAAQAALDKATGTALDQAATQTIYDPNSTVKQRIAAVDAAAPYITGDRYGSLYRLAVKGPGGEDGDGGAQFASLMYLARKGNLTEDEAFDQGSAAGLSGSQLNRVMEEVANKQDKDLKIGNELLEGAFARSAFAADFGPLAAAENEAKEDLRRWRAANPDAGPNDIASQAREIMVRRGRTAAVAVLSEVNAKSGDFEAPTPANIQGRMELLEDEMLKVQPGTSAAAELRRKYAQLEEAKRLLELDDGP